MTRYTITAKGRDGMKPELLKLLAEQGFESVKITEKVKDGRLVELACPTSPEAKAVADLYRRKHETPWADVEIRAFKELRKRNALTIETMTIIADYYRVERKKEQHYCRRELLTFLRHFDGELDRARQAGLTKQNRPLEFLPTKIVPLPELSEEARLAGVEQLRKLREGRA